jgi:hypothetical protein
MQFGLETEHWEIPFVYLADILIHLAGGETKWCNDAIIMIRSCNTRLLHFRIQNPFIDLINV